MINKRSKVEYLYLKLNKKGNTRTVLAYIYLIKYNIFIVAK